MANKHELIHNLKTVFDNWEEHLAGMSEEEIITQPGPGKWSVKETPLWLRGDAVAAVLKSSCEHHEHHLDRLRSAPGP